MSALEVRGVSLSFGGLKAVRRLSLEVQPRALFGLIGPNGAGKTTVFNLLTGVYAPDEGTIALDGQVIARPGFAERPHRICALGAARTFQNIRLFGELTVLDNVRVARHLRAKAGLLAATLRTPAFLREEEETIARSRELLRLFGLDELREAPARSLPYGLQRRLEIARALATAPKLLLLDEPAAGMTPPEKLELRALIRRVRDDFGCAVLLIEHDMGLVMRLCERVAVLSYGEKIAEGTPAEVQADRKVIEAYLGGGDVPVPPRAAEPHEPPPTARSSREEK